MISLLKFDDFIAMLPKGLETEITPEGRNLPKSIQLKILLCRALIGRRQLLLFEEDFNRLRSNVKNAFIQYLLGQDATVIVISNDFEVAKQFDRNIIMQHGRIISDSNLKERSTEKWFNEIF